MNSIASTLPLMLNERLRGFGRRLADVDVAQATALVDRLVADSGEEFHGLTRLAAVATQTQIAVVTLGSAECGAQAVVKVAESPSAVTRLRREAGILRNLSAERRLEALRPLLPVVLAEGRMDGWTYVVQRALPGVQGNSLFGSSHRPNVISAAADVADLLRTKTATMAVIGPGEMDRWIWRPTQTISRALASRFPRVVDDLKAVAGAAEATLLGHSLEVSWIHGDFWLGNLIFSPDGTRVTGVVDWEQAQEGHLPLMDLFHLILYAQRLAERRELGDVIRRVLRQGVWSDHDQRLLAHGGPVPEGRVLRATIIAYWLGHVASNFGQTSAYASNKRWLRKNLLGVLREARS